jgi:hypothetical protein
LLGDHVKAMYAFPTVQFVLIALGIRWIFRIVLGPGGDQATTIGVLVLALLPLSTLTRNGFPWAFQLLVPAFHMGAFVNALFATGLFLKAVEKMTLPRGILLAVLVLFASASDRLFWPMFLFPAGFACGVLSFRKPIRHRIIKPLAVSVGAAIAGYGALQWLEASFELRIEAPYASLAFDRIGPSWRNLWEVLAMIFSATMPITLTLMLTVAVILLLMRAAVLGLRRDPQAATGDRPAGSVAVLMALAFFPCVLFAPVLNGSFDGGDSLRYNFSVFVLGLLLTGVFTRDLSAQRAHRLVRWATIPVCLIALGAVATGLRHADNVLHYKPARVIAVDHMTKQLGLRTGVADYWDAKLMTLFSSNGLKVLPVFDNLALYIHVNREAMFYRSADGDDVPMEFSFVVVDKKGTLERTPEVLAKPCVRYEENGVSIYVMAPWRYDPSTRRPIGAVEMKVEHIIE